MVTPLELRNSYRGLSSLVPFTHHDLIGIYRYCLECLLDDGLEVSSLDVVHFEMIKIINEGLYNMIESEDKCFLA